MKGFLQHILCFKLGKKFGTEMYWTELSGTEISGYGVACFRRRLKIPRPIFYSQFRQSKQGYPLSLFEDQN